MNHRDRYLRQALVQGLDPATLQRLRIAVVGAGAVGNEVVKNLVMMGVGAIELFDFDHVELHNLTRSVFLREADVGLPKVTAVAARAAGMDAQVRITTHDADAWRALSLVQLRTCSALIACVDNLEARMRLSLLALLAGVRFIPCGIDARQVTVESMPFDAAALPACYECHLPASAYARVAERYSCGWLRRALWAEQVVPTTAVTASLAGALAVQAALAPPPEAAVQSRRMLLDAQRGHSTVSTLQRQPGCAACAGFAQRPRVIAARGRWREVLAEHAPQARALRLSDALVFGHRCQACGCADEGSAWVGRRADDFDDSITTCGACGAPAVQVDIHAETTPEALARCLRGRAPPLKFLLVEPAAAAGADASTAIPWLCLDLEQDPL